MSTHAHTGLPASSALRRDGTRRAPCLLWRLPHAAPLHTMRAGRLWRSGGSFALFYFRSLVTHPLPLASVGSSRERGQAHSMGHAWRRHYSRQSHSKAYV